MNIVYKTIEREIRAAVRVADERNRTIDSIELTCSEANELAETLRCGIYIHEVLPTLWTKYFTPGPLKSIVGKYLGVDLVVVGHA